MAEKKNILLYPLSLIYGIITGIRNFLYNTGILKSVKFQTPIICVGNITVGGTGKTPHCEYLIDILKDDFNVAILSRGYKRLTKGFLIASPQSDSTEIGDEPFQIYSRHPDITVALDSNRVRGVNRILQEKPETDVIILDDGFQHRKIEAGLKILLTDYNRLMIYDHLLPYGELRENINNMYRADIIIVTKCSPDLSPLQRRLVMKSIKKAPFQNMYFTTIVYGSPEPVFADKAHTTKNINILDEKTLSGILLVTGIADPAPLVEHIKQTKKEIRLLKFPDHHRYTEKDIAKINTALNSLPSGNKLIITTEKDAVRFREIGNIVPDNMKSIFYYIPIKIDFLYNEKEKFNKQVIDYIRKNRKINQNSLKREKL
ncbi:MAG TPA: tetraacyldisaccharide 4'-kinase [Bacteroidales bacterium]|nr:tetraacyldisaccharide 4'-kinase [Bacteroidales bacterium]HOU95520.1 tetraacyldisaccharide 4'-kinase [Bacteroidales bacterium]HQG36225.1 tetraacyldisaccharide 4'-kinase [Bacteroidales bacterium]HQG52283.1 tetraacyldisaccharide 4'-kinase [Bacteroidales bacterium]HQJ19919.1 tetraacyldisaccharide 4'-kinase [Bacteroidales bacterium]